MIDLAKPLLVSDITPVLEKRFLSHVKRGGAKECWPFIGKPHSLGRVRPRFNIAGKRYKVHRVAWVIYNKRDLPVDVLVCHSCDNLVCVNPAHIRSGDAALNARDRVRNGLQFRSSTYIGKAHEVYDGR